MDIRFSLMQACRSPEPPKARSINEPLVGNPTNLARAAKPIDAVVWLTEPDTHCFTRSTVKA